MDLFNKYNKIYFKRFLSSNIISFCFIFRYNFITIIIVIIIITIILLLLY